MNQLNPTKRERSITYWPDRIYLKGAQIPALETEYQEFNDNHADDQWPEHEDWGNGTNWERDEDDN